MTKWPVMDNSQSALFNPGMFRTLVSLLLLPIDLARLTCLCVYLTVRFIYRNWLGFISAMPANSAMEFYPCMAQQAPQLEWDDKRRFVFRRTLTLRVLELYCGRKDVAERMATHSAVTLTARRYWRMALGLGLTWILAVGTPIAAWRSINHFTNRQEMADEFKRAADKLFGNGAYDRARIQYLNAIQQKSSDVAAQWGLAQCTLELKRFQDARQALERVLSIHGDHRPARTALIDLLLKQGRAAEALQHALDLVKRAPDDVEAIVRLGKCQQSLGRPRAARRQAEAALARAPGHSAALLFAAAVAADLGDRPAARDYVGQAMAAIPTSELDRLVVARIMGKCGDYTAAIDQLKKRLEVNPADWIAARELAEMQLANGDVDAAIRGYMKLAQMAAGDAAIQVRLAELLLAAGRLDEAHATGEALARQMPHDKAGHMVLAMVYYLKGLWTASAENCRTSLQIAPKSVPARTLLARVLMRQDKHGEAARLLEPMRAEGWPNPEIPLMLAECYVEQDSRRAASDLLDSIRAANPTSDAPYLLLARLHVNAGETSKAASAYRKALELNPRQTVALNNLAALLSANEPGDDRQLQEAHRLAAEAWSLRPDNPEIADTLGRIQALRGDYYSAVSLLSYSARLLPRQPQVHYHLAHAYEGLNRLSEAAEQLDAAVNMAPSLAERKEVRELRAKLEAREKKGLGNP